MLVFPQGHVIFVSVGIFPGLIPPYSSEAELRSFLPGDGHVDVQEWTDAVKATGYDGSWSAETYSPFHWEMDLYELSRECKKRMEKFILN